MRNKLDHLPAWQKVGFLLFILISLIGAQDDRLRLKRADLLENITVDGKSMQYLKGNVIFKKGEMIMNCDWARFNQRTEQGFLFGNVSMVKDVQNLTCDSLFVDSPKDIMIAYSNTHVWDTTYSLVADTLFYFSELDSGSANGSATLIQDKQTIDADRIEYIELPEVDGVSYAARGNVSITEEGRLATCGEAIYDRENGKTVLRIKPEIVDNNQTIAGSEIFLEYDEDILKTLFIPSEAHAIHPSTGIRQWTEIVDGDTTSFQDSLSFSDDMTGSILRGFFVDGKLDSMRLEGMATTLYHIFEDSVYQGKNEASGDTITMKFGENDLEKIFVSGGSRGTYTPDSTGADMDGPVVYESEDIEYDVTNEFTDLHGDAIIDYTNVNLMAGFINVAWRNNLLKAFPESERDTSYGRIRPSMVENGEEPMVGDAMVYNLETRHGKVIHGKTKAQDGYYHGQEIRNQSMDVFYIDDATYTTCELDEPHFHFQSKNMKMINEDKVIARPIILYIANIPIFGLPFGVFPHQKGRRHSGWIMPSYGNDSRWGQYINGLGYYWAFNDFFDSKFTMSLYDRDGVTLRTQNKYIKRYAYSGNFDLETKQRFSGSVLPKDKDIYKLGKNRQSDYVVHWNHNQRMRNNQSAAVSASYYSSGDYNRRTGIEQSKRLNQQAVSNATYSKRWPKSKNSLSLNLSSRRDLMAERKIDPTSVFYSTPTRTGQQINITNNTLPQMAFSHSQRAIFPTKAKKKKWYNNINYHYSSRFTNNLKNYYESEAYVLDDTTAAYRWKMDANENPTAQTFADYFMSHTSGLNMSAKIFKYFNVSPNISLKSDWVNRTYSGTIDTTGKIKKNEVKGFAARTTGSFNLSMSTQVYGLFPVKIGKINSIRHTIAPSVGYSYRPDFSREVFGADPGYYEIIQQDNGEVVYFDRFSGTMAGGTPRGESQSMNFSMNNVFQAKIVDGDKERKQDLFSWRMGTSRNFVADEFQWSNISSSVRANVSKKLNLDFSMVHDWYDFDKEKNMRINKFKTSGGVPTPRLINASFSTGFRFAGKRLSFDPDEETTEEDTTETEERMDGANLLGMFMGGGNTGQKNTGELWSTSASFRFAYNNFNPSNTNKTFWMSTNSTINVTENWKVNYNARFDLINQNLVSHTFSVYRDLHCWELSLNWTPSGYASGVYLKLNVKSPNLRDLKLEQRGGTFSRPSLFDR
ncbi:MAG: putative LPS assembly protein LptD [Candidatus Marinimicrobia bacterium]|nr:putative LPS assembly protein LptD [Candidatus Neomarinimicrobiota bacterium]